MASEKVIAQLEETLYATGADTALVRGERAPPRPPATVTVAPGVAASVTATQRCAAIRVTAEARCGRTVRRYGGSDVRAAGNCAARLTADRDPAAVWLCGRARFAAWWSERTAERLERRLADAARTVNAPLVAWTVERKGAVGDRYDVVLDP